MSLLKGEPWCLKLCTEGFSIWCPIVCTHGPWPTLSVQTPTNENLMVEEKVMVKEMVLNCSQFLGLYQTQWEQFPCTWIYSMWAPHPSRLGSVITTSSGVGRMDLPLKRLEYLVCQIKNYLTCLKPEFSDDALLILTSAREAWSHCKSLKCAHLWGHLSGQNHEAQETRKEHDSQGMLR